jgi:hypothetical protein
MVGTVKKLGGKILKMASAYKAFVWINDRKYMAYGYNEEMAASNLLDIINY